MTADRVRMSLLVSNAADLSARTRIDDFTTPLEAPRNGRCFDAVKILERLAAS